MVGDERLISIDLVKFNLDELKGKDIESAMLQLFARTANLRQPARLVDIHRVREAWSESDVTFNSQPNWDPVPIATAAIYGAGGWYSWNITGSVIEAVRNGEVSVAVALRSVAEESEEQVAFVSTEGLSKVPAPHGHLRVASDQHPTVDMDRHRRPGGSDRGRRVSCRTAALDPGQGLGPGARRNPPRGRRRRIRTSSGIP